MKLKPIASNQTELERGHVTVFFSYSTPVAAFVAGRGAIRTAQHYSRTTSKHITLALRRWGASKAETVPQAELDALAS